MNIKEKFLELTKSTCPHGHESNLYGILDSRLNKDNFGNFFLKIGESDVMFTSHLDTSSYILTDVKHVISGNIIRTDGSTILGADDKAGVVIMLYMIENNIPGLYYFFVGEERGCVGSRKVATKLREDKVSSIKKVISFDRRGYTSIITYQGRRGCSEKFANALAKELNKADDSFAYRPDPTGLFTDSIQFAGIVPECTNISVGYENEHTFTEEQDIEFLEKLANACLKVDWYNLPIERNPETTDYAYGGYTYRGGNVSPYGRSYGYDWDDWDYGYGSSAAWNKKDKEEEKPEKKWFFDKKNNWVSYVEILKNKIISVDICEERIEEEKSLIINFFKLIEMQCEKIEWDGFNLRIIYEDGDVNKIDRNELLEFIPELDHEKYDDLTEKDINSIVNQS